MEALQTCSLPLPESKAFIPDSCIGALNKVQWTVKASWDLMQTGAHEAPVRGLKCAARDFWWGLAFIWFWPRPEYLAWLPGRATTVLYYRCGEPQSRVGVIKKLKLDRLRCLVLHMLLYIFGGGLAFIRSLPLIESKAYIQESFIGARNKVQWTANQCWDHKQTGAHEAAVHGFESDARDI